MTNNFALVEEYLIAFLKDEVLKTGIKNVVLGLSGGIDSAVVSVLAKKAFKDNLTCIMMPTNTSSSSSLEDALTLCEKFDLSYKQISIQPYIDAYKSVNPNHENLELGNFIARMRMATLYDISAKQKALVLGTSNKSELLLGYGTIFGDLSSALNPIGDLYKSEIFAFAKYLDIPQNIISKPPSADLWTGQSDEEDLGHTYTQLDVLLYDMVELRLATNTLYEKYDEIFVKKIQKRVFANQFKRKMPLIAKLTSRSIGHDFLYPRDIKL